MYFQGADIIRERTKHQLNHHEQNEIIEKEKARKANDMSFRQEVNFFIEFQSMLKYLGSFNMLPITISNVGFNFL